VTHPQAEQVSESPRSARARATRIALAAVVSCGAVAILAAQVDWGGAFDGLRGARVGWIAVALCWSVVIVWGRGIRWTALQPEPGLGVNTAAISVQTFYNRIAPMRVGELTLPFLLHRHGGQEASRTLVLLIVVRMVELAVVIGLLGLSILLRTGTAHGGQLVVIIVTLAAMALVLARFRGIMRFCLRIARWLARRARMKSARWAERAMERLEQTLLYESQLSGRQRVGLLTSTVVLQAMQIASFDAILRAFGVGLDLLALVQATSVALAGPALPMPSVGMVGTLEASWTAGFVWVGVPLEIAVVTGIVTQVVTLLFAALSALPAWWFLVRKTAARSRPPSRW
jgi:uncharacterized protein (TIRG00374 family)